MFLFYFFFNFSKNVSTFVGPILLKRAFSRVLVFLHKKCCFNVSCGSRVRESILIGRVHENYNNGGTGGEHFFNGIMLNSCQAWTFVRLHQGDQTTLEVNNYISFCLRFRMFFLYVLLICKRLVVVWLFVSLLGL